MFSKSTFKLLIICLSLIIIILIIFFSIQKKNIKIPNTYRIYYNKIDNEIISQMSNYDINIVEALFFNSNNVETIHSSSSSKLIGYISLVEIGSWDSAIIKLLNENDYLLDENNNKILDLNGNNYLGNLSSSHYREVLLNVIQTRIADKNMDGVFFDTLDWIDYYLNNELLYSQLSKGYKSFLLEFKNRFPSLMIIQNRGFESYKNFSNKYIDGLLWENFNSPYINNSKEEVSEFKNLTKIIKKAKTAIYVISFINEEENRNIAKKYNWSFLFSQMNKRYSNWNINIR